MSKLVDANEKIAKAVTTGYQAMESKVVNSYKAIENGAVTGFTKVTDQCIKTLFSKEGETIADTKNRLSKKQMND